MQAGGCRSRQAAVGGRFAVLVTALWLVSATLAASSCWALPQVKLVQDKAASGDTVRVKVFVYSRAPLGAYAFRLSHHPATLDLLSIDGGAAEFSAPPVTNPSEFTQATVRFAAFQAARLEGPTGKVHVATITLRARSRTNRPRITIDPLTLADTAGRTYRVLRRGTTLRLRRPAAAGSS